MKKASNILLMLGILGYSFVCGYIGNEQKRYTSRSATSLTQSLGSILDFGLGHPASVHSGITQPKTRSELTHSQILELIDRAATSHKVDPALVRAVVSVESGFNHRAVARDGGKGLMQLMPGTASWLGAKDALDPVQNLQAGTRYLKILLEKFNNKLEFAVAAYNAGPSVVQEYNGIPPFPSTQQYVRKVMALYRASPQFRS
jgi:soluble lytic murein transglycosylase-like protein